MSAEFWYRMVLLSLSGFLIGTTLVICVRYYFAWRAKRNDWRGLLPYHVFTVTLSYDLLLIYSTVETLIRIGENNDVPWWRAVLLIPAYVCGFVAMWAVYRLRSKNELKENA